MGQQGMQWTTKVENQNPKTAVADTLEREELAKRRGKIFRSTRLLNMGYVDSALAKQVEGDVDVDIESEAHTIDDGMISSPVDADKRGNPQETAVAAKRSASVAPSVASTRGHWSMRSGSPRSCSRDPTNEGPPMKGSITKSVFVPKKTTQEKFQILQLLIEKLNEKLSGGKALRFCSPPSRDLWSILPKYKATSATQTPKKQKNQKMQKTSQKPVEMRYHNAALP